MRKIKQVIGTLLSAGLVVGMVVAPSSTAEAAKKGKAVKVKAPYTKNVYIAKRKKVKLSVGEKVTFQSKNKKVATVSKKGIVVAKKVGKTKIVVKAKKNKKKKATITVRVMKCAVKKVSLKQKNISVQVGTTASLKATVKAKKGASKRLYWKSSNVSVAGVSGKGVVTGKKVGTATITVQATDGSKKKATCKVRVTENAANARPTPMPTDDIVGMTVMNKCALTFALARPHTLSESDIKIQKRSLAYGEYRVTLDVDMVYSTDGQNYTVVLSEEMEVSQGEFVKLTIPSLEGLKEKEVMYLEPAGVYSDENVYRGIVGEKNRWTMGFHNNIGYSQYAVTGLPEGFTYEDQSGSIRISGTPTQVGIHEAKLTATDEYGNTYVEKIIFCFGDASHLVAYSTGGSNCILGRSGNYVSGSVMVSGGSGAYNYEVQSTAGNFTVSGDGWLRGTPDMPGEYVVNVLVTDANNPALTTTTTATFRMEEGVEVTGMVRDAVGNPVTNSVRVSFQSSDATVPNPVSVTTYCDEEGKYSVVLPRGTYDVRVNDGQEIATIVSFDRMITISQAMDFALPLYQVTLVNPQGESFGGHVCWNVTQIGTEKKSLGWGDKIYLRPGNYEVVTRDEPYQKASFAVGTEALRVVVSAEQ